MSRNSNNTQQTSTHKRICEICLGLVESYLLFSYALKTLEIFTTKNGGSFQKLSREEAATRKQQLTVLVTDAAPCAAAN